MRLAILVRQISLMHCSANEIWRSSLPRPNIATKISELLQISCRRISDATPIAARLRKKTKAWKIVYQRWRRRTRSLPLEHLGRETCEFLIVSHHPIQ
jgi:hypothetical protein